MLVSNSMRFCTDIFGLVDEEQEQEESQEGESSSSKEQIIAKFTKKALLVSKVALDCTDKTQVTAIDIAGSEPSGTKRRFMFMIDDKVYKFSSGSLVEFTGDLTVDNVLKSGNAASGLGSLTNITDFVGKEIYPIIALSAPSDADEFPTAKIALRTRIATDTLTKTVKTPAYPLTEDDSAPKIISVNVESSVEGGGSATVKMRMKDKAGDWSDYMSIADAAGREAVAVQFRLTYKVSTGDGSDSAQIDSISVEHTLGKTLVNGNRARFFSTVANYEVPLQLCYVTVRHDPLTDASINAYVNFMQPPKHRSLIQIGIATGSRQELTLGVNGVADSNIDVSSLEIYADDEPLVDFDANSEVSTVTLTAKKNAILFASYDYDHGVEDFKRMTAETCEPYTDGFTYVTRYSYMLPDSQATNKTISNITLVLNRPTGNVSNYSLGKATGKRQLFTLPHQATMSSIKFSEKVDWDYDEDSGILSLVAKKNTVLSISYKWTSEQITIHSWAAGWAVA